MTHRTHDHPSADKLQAFLEGEVSRAEHRSLESHIAGCARCEGEVEMWRSLLGELGQLAAMRPHEGFAERVMMGVELPQPTPLAARVRERLLGLAPTGASGHLDVDRVQDLLEGFLPGREAARIRAHLDDCASCSADVVSWKSVFGELDRLERFAPAEGFTDAVLAGIEVAAPAPVRVPLRSRAMAWGRRLVPQTRRAWAALSGVAVTPAAIVGLLVYAVFSRPALTPGALLSYAAWQVGDAVAWATTTLGGLFAEGLGAVGLSSVVQVAAAAPLLVGAAFLVYTAACAFAIRILYRNLITSHPLDGHYARASFS